jgi:hypothetical protein
VTRSGNCDGTVRAYDTAGSRTQRNHDTPSTDTGAGRQASGSQSECSMTHLAGVRPQHLSRVHDVLAVRRAHHCGRVRHDMRPAAQNPSGLAAHCELMNQGHMLISGQRSNNAARRADSSSSASTVGSQFAPILKLSRAILKSLRELVLLNATCSRKLKMPAAWQQQQHGHMTTATARRGARGAHRCCRRSRNGCHRPRTRRSWRRARACRSKPRAGLCRARV